MSRNLRCRVPAGIKWPTITFSFSPYKGSTFALIAASVKTFVVSWNEAAEIKESVARAACVMPKRMGSPTAGFVSRTVTSRKSRRFISELTSRNWRRSTRDPIRNPDSPASVTTNLSYRSSLSSSSWNRAMSSSSSNFVSPGSVMRIFCIIWRTITSMCLSLIATPCNR